MHDVRLTPGSREDGGGRFTGAAQRGLDRDFLRPRLGTM